MSQQDDDEPPLIHPQRLANPTAKRPEAPKKDYDRLVKAAWDAHWWCFRGGQYIICRPPDRSGAIVVPSTPSSQRTLRRLRQKFRAKGVDC